MARIDNLLEGGQGTLKNLVLYQMNGKSFIRSKPARYRDKKSPAQLAQRQRLQVVTSFLRQFSDLLRITFAAEALGRSALQAAQSHNMKNALAGEYPDIHIDKSRAVLSKGPLPLPLSASMETHPEGLLIRWENGQEAAGSTAGDTLVAIVLHNETGPAEFRFTEVRRTEGQYVWKTAQPATEDALPAVWIAFRNAKMTEMSDSMPAIS